jgi:hypothetical protein
MQRRLPTLQAGGPATRPLSIVTVHFSGDLEHNLLRSPCVADPLNQLVRVDNVGNIHFDTLSQAIQSGLDQARHDLVAVVHEDVLLPEGWQQALELALADLEAVDPEWGLAGSVGWMGDGRLMGHFSDPGGYWQLFEGCRHAEVVRLDEQLLLMRRSRPLPLDPQLPSIHNLGRDLPLAARVLGRRTYALDAPTIHKYADAQGRPILTRDDSPKIRARSSYAWRADYACSADYIRHKWPQIGALPLAPVPVTAPAAVPAMLERPVVLLARGGGGSRLLSSLARDAGLFVGNDVNVSGDALELVLPIYKALLNRHHRHPDWQRAAGVAELRDAAARMLDRAGAPAMWGFKLPESLLVLEEILQAFPGARFLHLVRDPLATCLRRTHLTARVDNQIGQATLPAAYRYCGRPTGKIHADAPALHMALTSRHQVESALDLLDGLAPERSLQLRYEDLLADPAAAITRAACWIHGRDDPPGLGSTLLGEVDPGRAVRTAATFAPEVEAEVAAWLAPLRSRLGYAAPR